MTLADLTDFGKDSLARYKRPKKLMVVDALPRGATGKVLKRDLRRMPTDDTAEPVGRG